LADIKILTYLALAILPALEYHFTLNTCLYEEHLLPGVRTSSRAADSFPDLRAFPSSLLNNPGFMLPKLPLMCGAAFLCLVMTTAHAQPIDSLANKAVAFPSRLLGRIQAKINGLNADLTRQTERYLQKMERQEQRIRKKMAIADSAGAQRLFAGVPQQYAAYAQKLQTDTGGGAARQYSGVYLPWLDSLQGATGYLAKNSPAQGGGVAGAAGAAVNSDVQTYEARLMDADDAKAFIRQRQQTLSQYITQHTDLQSLLAKPMAGVNQQLYYYSQQLRQYKEMWNDPDKMEQQALALLDKLPAFQSFMKQNSFLAGIMGVPAGYGTSQALNGLQTKDQVAQAIQNQVAAGGDGGASGLQSSLESAESQLDNYKSKLSSMGTGNGDIPMPDFKPNDQKTKTFWKRLQYGVDFQTSRNNYYFPTVTDFGGSLAYKLGHDNLIGVGASYKLGWGNGIQDIAFTSEGVGLRSFLQIKIKSSFSATGGFEYNYTTPFVSYQQLKQLQYWTKSGLIGVTKTISMKNRLFKSTTLSLLWDFLSYQQVPQTQPFVFRIGYTF
jgi:hypothetical protein